ncbi:MAG: MEDS domain-containing protein [Candidatus Binatia bacterium]
MEDAQTLFALASRTYPAAASHISKSVGFHNAVFQGTGKGKDVFWGEIFPSEHFVQIYEDEAVFMDALEGFIKGGLQADDGVIVLATDAHLDALETRLEVSGIDLETARAQGRYTALEAAQILESFMVKNWPDDKLFTSAVTQLITRARGDGRKVRAFGEMVAVLWARGDQGATVRLEYLWNELCQTEAFSLFCAYPKAGFTRDATQSINEICAAHSRLIAA